MPLKANRIFASKKSPITSSSSSRMNQQRNRVAVAHQGALSRIDEGMDATYEIEIAVHNDNDDDDDPFSSINNNNRTRHTLEFPRKDFEFASRLFAILDTESSGIIDMHSVREFVILRCPVLWRRDDDLRKLRLTDSESPTFDEIWRSVITCSNTTNTTTSSSRYDPFANNNNDNLEEVCIGVEGWMVFCRFIALAQYLEAKRRFSARHLQQTMRHRNSPRGSEVVVVDVPPPEPPAPLSPYQLAEYETKNKSPLPLPELDLDHSLLGAHDTAKRKVALSNQGLVKISLFGGGSFTSGLLSTQSTGASNSSFDFALTFHRPANPGSSILDDIVVRRSISDLKWLDDTFTSQKVLGGTLSGRILPPFPGRITKNGVLSSHFQSEDSVINTSLKTTGGAITAAAVGVDRIRSAAKSFFGSYMKGVPQLVSEESTTTSHTTPPHKKVHRSKRSVTFALSESYYNPNSPECKARQLERYLNYLLEHPALSTSFPLNSILKASQSGLEATKQSIEECKRVTDQLRGQSPQIEDGKMTIPFWSSSGSGVGAPSFPWVRTAAQAAVALKVHGMLETTGLNSASARLQHASLPSFGAQARLSGWDEEDIGVQVAATQMDDDILAENENVISFEEGVQSVQSCLQSEVDAVNNDYDLLPLPVPAPERRILCAGSETNTATDERREARFHYGTGTLEGSYNLDDEDDARSAFLGEVAVDENIDKLREVIGSVENTLSRSLASSGGIGKARKERQALQLLIVKGLDSWEGFRGRFVSQRSLLKGVSGIEQSKATYEESDLALIEDLSWQTSLASAAVSAAEDVRSSVRVSRTAASAKAAAISAADAAQSACSAGNFTNIDEARAAQTRASMAQSHAIHAAVVEHEAKTVKRRATLALAHDVKYWNIHRKREMLLSCLSYARSQHEATRRTVDAWSTLRDGFIGTTVIPAAPERRAKAAPSTAPVPAPRWECPPPLVEQDEVTATIFEDRAGRGPANQPAIIAVEHHEIAAASKMLEVCEVRSPTGESTTEAESFKPVDFFPQSDLILPFATAAPIPEEEPEDLLDDNNEEQKYRSESAGDEPQEYHRQQQTHESSHEEVLSASMQSLVDGLMNWGGGFDTEEEHFALPIGMAASLAFEDNNTINMGAPNIA